MTKFKVVRYWDTYPDGVVATCDTEEEHDYLVVDTKHGVCVIHAESCPCRKKK